MESVLSGLLGAVDVNVREGGRFFSWLFTKMNMPPGFENAANHRLPKAA
jgi:hypothetical protein